MWNEQVAKPTTLKQTAAKTLILLAKGSEKYRLMCVLTGISMVNAMENRLRTADEIQSVFDTRLMSEHFTGIGEALIADMLARM